MVLMILAMKMVNYTKDIHIMKKLITLKNAIHHVIFAHHLHSIIPNKNVYHVLMDIYLLIIILEIVIVMMILILLLPLV